MSEQEVPLAGGQVNTVVRVGDTVRRATRRDTHGQQALLAHLERKALSTLHASSVMTITAARS